MGRVASGIRLLKTTLRNIMKDQQESNLNYILLVALMLKHGKCLLKTPKIVFIIFSFFVKHKKIYVTFTLLLIYCTGDKNSSK